jgi:hypothetical protein
MKFPGNILRLFLFPIQEEVPFYGTSANAVKTQIWVAMIVYLLLAILKERYRLEQTLSQLLHFLEVNIFEQKSMLSIFQMNSRSTQKVEIEDKQLRLFDL